ncbi:MAG TPA: hypothetical protein P5256_08135 [Beijerinckiaceae bacterium]|nr:hypothetical protein [Hyphomicrobiales bacterium]MCO5086013.1 hypothetical protein [Methylobacteriaceae bacterium]HRY03080.1 hypothetical protein [Beijerinckiaceae bacterium]
MDTSAASAGHPTPLSSPDANGWHPIATAPRIPYAPLDLWVVPGKPLNNLPRAAPYREANATSSGNGKHWLTSKGRYLEGRRYYDDEGDECLDLEDRSADATIVTHWRPLPGAPVERA